MKTSKYQLDFLEALRRCEQGEITVSNLASVISEKLEELARWANLMGEEEDSKEIEKLWEQFNFISGDRSATEDELDQALEELYDWADSPGQFDSNGDAVPNVLLCRVRSS